jgi:hypothetical protein
MIMQHPLFDIFEICLETVKIAPNRLILPQPGHRQVSTKEADFTTTLKKRGRLTVQEVLDFYR